MYLGGAKVRVICEAIGIKVDKWRDWQYNNTRGFGDWYAELRRERILMRCEQNLDDFVSKNEIDKKIKSDMTKFGLSTLGKKVYSTKQEVCHAGSLDLVNMFTDEQFKKIADEQGEG